MFLPFYTAPLFISNANPASFEAGLILFYFVLPSYPERKLNHRYHQDEEKNQINQKKHKISFEEAQSVFFDEEALIIDDPEHSLEEERFIILGLSKKANLLVVCHCYRKSDTIIRIISARKATVRETISYNKNLF